VVALLAAIGFPVRLRLVWKENLVEIHSVW
jgi:hypothetical protein